MQSVRQIFFYFKHLKNNSVSGSKIGLSTFALFLPSKLYQYLQYRLIAEDKPNGYPNLMNLPLTIVFVNQ